MSILWISVVSIFEHPPRMNGHYTASVVSWERHIQWSLGQAGGAVKQSSWVAEGILILCDHDLVDGNQIGLLADCGVSPKDRW
jgi:hypothetical protein